MANFFGGFFKQIEKPQDTHPPSVPQELSKYDNEYITYCIEQEKTVSELEAGLHTNDDPEEIAKKALAAACSFYGADWAGTIELDLELNIWASGWWHNTNPKVKELEKLQEFENLMVMPSIVDAIKKQKPIIICDIEDIVKGLSLATGVLGRVEVVPTDTDYTVIIDYAHTPDGLMNIIDCVKGFAKGRVITLFGCGGDRDNRKRPIMGEIATDRSDFCIITSDNPRGENPDSIIDEIVSGVKVCKDKYITITDRRRAIGYALDIAKAGDVIILAGKGQETYQIIGKEKFDFDERIEVYKHLKSK